MVDIEPSRIIAPLLDLSFEGHVVYKGAKPTGTLTVHMRNFDRTQAALKTLGPDVEKKVAPMLAMAKGLAKTDGDGSLVCVVDHRSNVGVAEQIQRVQFVRGAEAVEEMQERHAQIERRHLCDQRAIVRLLH